MVTTETSWNSLGEIINGEKYASFSTDERTYISMVYKLKEKCGDEIIIKAEPKDNGGCLYCWIPAKYLRLMKPRQMNLTEEQREQRRNAFKKNVVEKKEQIPDVSITNEGEKLPFTDLYEDLFMENAEREFEW